MTKFKVIVVLFIAIVANNLNAQQIEVSFFGDIRNETIGIHCQKSIETFSDLIDNVWKQPQDPHKYFFKTDSITQGDLFKQFAEKAGVTDKDVSIFYFTGYFKKGEKKFPLIRINETWMDSKLLYEILRSKPGLNIFIIDGISEKCSSNLTLENEYFSQHEVAKKLFNNYKGNVFAAIDPNTCSVLVNQSNTLFSFLLTNVADSINIEKLNWKNFLRNIDKSVQNITSLNNLGSSELEYLVKVKKRKPPLKPVITNDTTFVNYAISFDDIMVGGNIANFLGDTMLSIIRNPDSVICRQIVTRIDSSGGKGSEFTYNVAVDIGTVSPDLHSIIRYLVLSDETYADSSIVIKHQFEPVLTFSFIAQGKKVVILYSPANRSFGFGFKGLLLNKTYKKSVLTDKIFIDILNHINANKK